MYLVINFVGLAVFIAIGFLLSRDRKKINKRGIATLLVLNFFVAWFFLQFPIGRAIIEIAANGFTWILNIAYKGIAFAFPDWVNVPQMNFFTSVLAKV